MKNRILYLIPSAKIGGTETMLAALAAELAAKGFSPLVVTMGKRGPFHDMLDRAGIRNRPLDLKRRPATGLFRLAAVLVAARPALIHSFLFWGNLLGKFLRVVTGIPLIMSQRSTDDWKSRFHWYAEYFPPRIPAAVVSNSSAGVRTLRARTNVPHSRIRFIPNGISLGPLAETVSDKRAFGFPGEAAVVGSVGNLRPAKGYDHFFRAARIIAARRPDTVFAVAGEGPERARLERLAAELGIASRTRLPGFVSPVYNYLACFDIVVIPSLWEGFPVSALEAMGMGKPVVATSVGDLPEIIEDGVSGFLVRPARPEELADRVMRLLADPGLARRMGEAARERVQVRYRLEKTVDAYAALYRKVMG